MCRAETCPSSPCALAHAMPSHQLIQPMRPRLPRKLAATARINLNKYWHVLEELMPARRVADEADSNAINENLDNERRLAALQLSGPRVAPVRITDQRPLALRPSGSRVLPAAHDNEQVSGPTIPPAQPQDEQFLAALRPSGPKIPAAPLDNKDVSEPTISQGPPASSKPTPQTLVDSSTPMAVDSSSPTPSSTSLGQSTLR